MEFLDLVHTRPEDVKDGYAVSIKLVAVAGYDGDWTCYCGPTNWSDKQVADQGDVVLESQAKRFAYLMQLRRYIA